MNPEYMREALDLARQCRELASPNPMVGAVLVRLEPEVALWGDETSILYPWRSNRAPGPESGWRRLDEGGAADLMPPPDEEMEGLGQPLAFQPVRILSGSLTM